jgi:hypothetical protein
VGITAESRRGGREMTYAARIKFAKPALYIDMTKALSGYLFLTALLLFQSGCYTFK